MWTALRSSTPVSYAIPICLVSLCLAGCFNQDEREEAPAATERAVNHEADSSPPAGTPAATKIDTQPDTTTATPTETPARETSIDDLRYPDATFLAENKLVGNRESLVLESSDDAETLQSFYAERFREDGWVVQNKFESRGQTFLQFGKPGKQAVVTLDSSGAGTTRVSIGIEHDKE